MLSLLLQWNTTTANFTYDDARGIVANKDLRPETSIWNVFVNDFWGYVIT